MKATTASQRVDALWTGVSPLRLAELQHEVQRTALGSYLEGWIVRYNEVGRRGEFLWKWCLQNCRLVTLPCIDPAYRDHLAETKLVHLVFLCLVDDIVDERCDREMFSAARMIAQGQGRHLLIGFDRDRRRYLELIHDSWIELWQRMERYPRWEDFADDIRFDYATVMQCLWHSLRVNRSPERINVAEHDANQPHNMAMVYMAMLDLCCSPDFHLDDLGVAREVFLHGQMMGRIGNTVATWERELAVRDFSSGMFAYALDAGAITRQELVSAPVQQLAQQIRNAGVEGQVLRIWRVHRDKMAQKIERIRSVDLRPYLLACEDLVATHLSGRGHM